MENSGLPFQNRSGLSGPRRWLFGRFAFDERTLELTAGGAGIKVDKKPLDVLLHLLQHPGEVVSKDDLQAAVWPGRIISDTVLAKTLSRLREVLHDRDESLIKTVRGYGYRLMVPVEIEISATGEPSAHQLLVDAAQAERRQLTVLCCSWADGATLSEESDPETFHELMLAHHECAGDIVKHHGGHTAQLLGDGMTVFFGYPVAHDNDAERATRCGLDLLQAFAGFTRQPHVSVKVGVHTGLVVVGGEGIGQSGAMAFGLTCTLAARVKADAAPDTVAISDATLKLAGDLFVTQKWEASPLSGNDIPLQIHQVIQSLGVRNRLEVAQSLHPFVGRELELSLLERLWQQVEAGHGNAVLISGEPGLGKSRLLLQMREQLGDGTHTWLECRAEFQTRDRAYLPIIRLLRQMLQLTDADSAKSRLQRLEDSLDAVQQDKYQAVPLLAPLLGLEPSVTYPPSQLAPEANRQQTNELLSCWLVSLSKRQPLLLTIEDLHWADTATVDVLTRLLDHLPNVRILMMMTARPQFVSPWRALHFTDITLNALGSRHAAEMLENLVGDRTPSSELTHFIQDRASGVPLFLEELTRNMLESGQIEERDGVLDLAASCDRRSVPTRLQDLLTARLDRLGPARECAQIASAIGREIPHRLLALVAKRDELRLQPQLECLIEAGLLYVRGTRPEASYFFKHALIQDAAYNSLLSKTRQQLHRSIANTLEQHFPDRVRSDPAALAQHFQTAGALAKAVQYLEPAAVAALMRSSAAEAAEYCDRGLSLLADLADDESSASIELRLLLLLHLCRLTLLGPGHDEIGRVLARADVVRAKVENPLLQCQALANLSQHHLSRGELGESLAFATQIHQLDPRGENPLLQTVAGIASGWSQWMMGGLTAAWNELESALANLHKTDDHLVTQIIGSDGAASSLTPMPCLAWLLGFPWRAQELMQQALSAAESSDNFYSISLAGAFVGVLIPLLLRLPTGILEASARIQDAAKRHRFPGWESSATAQRGLALCAVGLHQEGLPMLDQALDEQSALGTRLTVPLYRGLQAQHCLIAGRFEDAALALDQAAKAMDGSHIRVWQAELFRLRGELLLAQSSDSMDTAAIWFQQALASARTQQAHSLELRAATSLSRLWQTQDRTLEALELLTPVIDYFTEGFDTPDLIDARALQRALSH